MTVTITVVLSREVRARIAEGATYLECRDAIAQALKDVFPGIKVSSTHQESESDRLTV